MIDPRIALGVQPVRVENPMNQLAQFLQVQGAQRQGEMDALKMRDMEEQRAAANALNDIYRGALKPDGTVDRAAMTNALATRGLGSKIPSLQKQWADVDKDLAEIDSKKATAKKNEFEIEKGRFEIAEKGYQAWRNMLASFRGNPNATPDAINAGIQQLVAAGLMNPESAQKMIAATPQDPAGIQDAIEKAVRYDLAPKDRLTVFAPNPTQVDNGQQIAFRDTNPNSPTYGQITAGGVTQKQATPGDVLQADTSTSNARLQADVSTANNKRSVGASMANAAATREIAKATRDAASIAANAKSETDIRKEFADLPETKKYKNAIPAYNAVVKAAAINNPQADINLIYGLAKLYDPDSVVREGEYGTIANSQAIPEWIKGQAQRLVGGGRLTEATKKQIIEQAKIRINSYKDEYGASEAAFRAIVNKRGLDPDNVLTPVGSSVTPKAGLPSVADIEAELARRQGKK